MVSPLAFTNCLISLMKYQPSSMPYDAAQSLLPNTDASKKFVPIRKRFQAKPHLPVIVLNGEGTIEEMSPTARRMLEYGKDDHVPPSFFSHVHGRNIYQVMRDVADIVCYGKPRASWLLRLRTGRGRWQWFRTSVTPHFQDGDLAIHIHLSDLSATSPR